MCSGGGWGILETSDWFRANCTQCQTAASLKTRTPSNLQTETKEQCQENRTHRTALRRRGCAVVVPPLVLYAWVYRYLCRGPDTAVRVRAPWDLGSVWQLCCKRHALISNQNEEQQGKSSTEFKPKWRHPGNVRWAKQRSAGGRGNRHTHTTGVVEHCCGTRGLSVPESTMQGKTNLYPDVHLRLDEDAFKN